MGSAPRERQQRLGEKLHQIRVALDLSQNELLDLLGVGDDYYPSFVSYWERGIREPPLGVLLKYARVYGVPMEVLVDDALNLPKRKPPRKSQPGKPKPKSAIKPRSKK